jgi:hypothetical protein
VSTPPTAGALLASALALIAAPERWCQRAYARDTQGVPFAHQLQVATARAFGRVVARRCSQAAYIQIREDARAAAVLAAWPAWTALVRAAVRAEEALWAACLERSGAEDYVAYNDAATTTHADVVALFARAQELVED